MEEEEDQLLAVPALIKLRFGYSAFLRLTCTVQSLNTTINNYRMQSLRLCNRLHSKIIKSEVQTAQYRRLLLVIKHLINQHRLGQAKKKKVLNCTG